MDRFQREVKKAQDEVDSCSERVRECEAELGNAIQARTRAQGRLGSLVDKRNAALDKEE